jgi:hypothetical protein
MTECEDIILRLKNQNQVIVGRCYELWQGR